MLARLTTRNQITIPKTIISKFSDIQHFDIENKDGCIVLKPIKLSQVDAVREKLKEMGITDQDVTDAVEWSRK